MKKISITPSPPYICAVFTSIRTNVNEGYEEMNNLLFNEIKNVEGYLGNEAFRDKDGFVLLFENPYQNEIPEDDETKMIYNTDVKKLKVSLDYGSILDEVIDREFEEIT